MKDEMTLRAPLAPLPMTMAMPSVPATHTPFARTDQLPFQTHATATAAHVDGHNVAVEQMAEARRQANVVMQRRVSSAGNHQTNVADGDAAIQNNRHTRPVTTANALATTGNRTTGTSTPTVTTITTHILTSRKAVPFARTTCSSRCSSWRTLANTRTYVKPFMNNA